MKDQYNKTITACFVGYIVQAVVNNFVPLLFLFFQRTYGVPLSQITLLVTFNFGIQLLVDLLSAGFVDKIGYRVSMVIAHISAAAGLILLTVLPEILPSPFAGILIAVMIYAIGGGLLEVLVSPVVEACPSDNKEKAMSMLHSFYCWGHVGVVLLSTIFFQVFGIQNWKIMALVWSVIPLGNAWAFARVPIAPLLEEGDTGFSMKELFGMKIFWVFMIMMVCAGASEQAVSQWASTFAEQGLGITKTAGDLAGPMAFAVLMGTARAFYGKYGDRIQLDRFMICSSILCIISYLGISLLPVPQISLLACAVCGLSVGIMWPGTFSKAARDLPKGGTAMFALLALGGDVGCSGGPTLVGFVSSKLDGNLKMGILAGILFPILLLIGILFCRKQTDDVKLFDSFMKKAEKGRSGNHKKVSDIRALEIYSGMRVVVEDPNGKLLFFAKLQELQQNTAELYQYSEGENLRETEAEDLHEVYHMLVKLRGYNESERKAVFMEGMITPLKKHAWRAENLIITKVENERSFPRFTTDIDAVIVSDEAETPAEKCRLLNISAGGACISSEYRYDKGDTFLMKVRLLEDEEPFVVYCEVLRVMERNAGFEYGCRFVELTEVDQEQMSQRIERFARRR